MPEVRLVKQRQWDVMQMWQAAASMQPVEEKERSNGRGKQTVVNGSGNVERESKGKGCIRFIIFEPFFSIYILCRVSGYFWNYFPRSVRRA